MRAFLGAEHCLQNTHEGDEVLLLVRRQSQLKDHVEELNCVFKGGQATVVEVRWRILDATQREGFHPAFSTPGVEVLKPQIVHLIVSVVRRRMTCAAICFAEEKLFPSQL